MQKSPDWEVLMNRRNFIKMSALISAYGSLGCMTPEPKKWNFLFILVDDLGWADPGCYGSRFYETPHIDRLAHSGMRFTDAYASCPVCSPTRASILTGQYPVRLNITDWIPGHDPKNRKLLGPQDLHQLPLEKITIAEILKAQGYRTFFAGKWHLGDQDFYPTDQGFDKNVGGYQKGGPAGGYYTPYHNPQLPDGPAGEYLTDRLTDETCRFIKKSKDTPFWAYLSFYTVHTPIQACERWVRKYKNKRKQIGIKNPERIPEHDAFTNSRQSNAEYASMVAAMDENVGRLLKTIKSLNLEKDTAIFFTSDNGGLSTLPARRTASTSNLPLRAGKGWLYEGGIRVPLCIRVPGVTTPGQICHVPVVSMDFFPTILDLLNLKMNETDKIDGQSLLPLLRGQTALSRDAIFWHYPHYHGSRWSPGAAVRAGKWKLIEFYDREKTELYNLADDPGEKQNLANQYPDRVKALAARLHDWQNVTGAQMPVVNPDYP